MQYGLFASLKPSCEVGTASQTSNTMTKRDTHAPDATLAVVGDAFLRADDALVRCGMVPSRARARLLIQEGRVRRADGTAVDKPARRIPATENLVVTDPPRFVSRGGDKLQHLIAACRLPVKGSNALDIGASTGGFTDCLLQNGAASVTAIDVGHSQLHPAVRNNPSVYALEGVNARELGQVDLNRQTFDIVVADVSFISLEHILGPAWERVTVDGWLGVLIKPQFELGREVLQRSGGVIRDLELQNAARDKVLRIAEERLPGARLIDCIDSPITGGDGNREFLGAWKKIHSSDT